MWAAQLNDDRFLPMFAKKMKEAEAANEPARPSLAGYSREVDGMFRVATELRLLRAELGKWINAPMILGPVFPSDRIQKQRDAQEVDDLQQAIAVGHRNWREAMTRG